MCEYSEYCDYGSKNKYVPEGVHIMNNAESKVMRKLKSKTGLSEEEIREIKKYRIILSTAQKEGEKAKRSDYQKLKDGIMKNATMETKLAKEHPKTKEVYKRLVEHDNKFYGRIFSPLSTDYKK